MLNGIKQGKRIKIEDLRAIIYIVWLGKVAFEWISKKC